MSGEWGEWLADEYATCQRCEHPGRHHDAGECWTDENGNETWGETACPCCWYEPEDDS